ncbi:MAG: hypothetical protein P0111_10870 [Nitrospira sp.]|nr:hypothetical protein [Nitrospira sp.]
MSESLSPVLDLDWITEYSKAMRVGLRMWIPLMLASSLVIAPVWAGDADTFDPEQPFDSLRNRLLFESLADHALDLLRDHLEISADAPAGNSRDEGRQSLRFRFYPEGKSKSDQYFAAEGWLGPSSDARRQELHFQFSLPGSSKKSSKQSDWFQRDNVL